MSTCTCRGHAPSPLPGNLNGRGQWSHLEFLELLWASQCLHLALLGRFHHRRWTFRSSSSKFLSFFFSRSASYSGWYIIFDWASHYPLIWIQVMWSTFVPYIPNSILPGTAAFVVAVATVFMVSPSHPLVWFLVINLRMDMKNQECKQYMQLLSLSCLLASKGYPVILQLILILVILVPRFIVHQMLVLFGPMYRKIS